MSTNLKLSVLNGLKQVGINWTNEQLNEALNVFGNIEMNGYVVQGFVRAVTNEDLNTVLKTGIYAIAQNAQYPSYHYPMDARGIMEILPDSLGIIQRFTKVPTDGKIWIRYYTTSTQTFTSWAQVSGDGSFTQIQSDWNETDTTSPAFIQNKPTPVWALTSGGGAYYGADVTPPPLVGRGNVVVFGQSDQRGDSVQSRLDNANIIIAPASFTRLATTAAIGATSYTLNSTNMAIRGDASHFLQFLWYAKDEEVAAQKPTSVSYDDVNDKVTITFTTSLNPTHAVDRLFVGHYFSSSGSIGAGNNVGLDCIVTGAYVNSPGSYNLISGYVIDATGAANLIVGQDTRSTGSINAIVGEDIVNSGRDSLVVGAHHTNTRWYVTLLGLGHDSTNGIDGVTAIGKYSNIISTSIFVVGNGTDANTRSNIFEVHTNGVARINNRRIVTSTEGSAVGSMSQPVYITSDGYVATCTLTAADVGAAPASHNHGNIASGGTITSTAVVSATNDYLIFSDTSNSGKIERQSFTDITSTLINSLSEGTSPANRDDYIVAQYSSGGTTTITYHRRKLSNIFAALTAADIPTLASSKISDFTSAARQVISATSPISYNSSTGVITHATILSNIVASGLYKFAVNTYGHITGVTAVQKSDITDLGIPGQDTTYEFADNYNASTNKGATVATVINAINGIDRVRFVKLALATTGLVGSFSLGTSNTNIYGSYTVIVGDLVIGNNGQFGKVTAINNGTVTYTRLGVIQAMPQAHLSGTNLIMDNCVWVTAAA